MSHIHARTVAATVSGLAGCLLLAACGSSSAPTHATSSGTQHSSANAPAAAQPSATHSATSSPHSGGATQPDTEGAVACSLITEKDVTVTVGTDPGQGAANRQNGATVCAYGSYPKPVLTVNVLPTRGRAGYNRVRHDSRVTDAAGTRVATVEAVGDQAFEMSGPHVDVIYFTKGDELIVIGLTGPTSPTRGAALALAKIADGRL